MKETPRQIGEPEPASRSDSIFGEQGNDPVPAGVLARRLSSIAVILVRLHVLAWPDLLRDALNTWIQILQRAAGNEPLRAAVQSDLYPFFWGFSVPGRIPDRRLLAGCSRALVIIICLFLATVLSPRWPCTILAGPRHAARFSSH